MKYGFLGGFSLNPQMVQKLEDCSKKIPELEVLLVSPEPAEDHSLCPVLLKTLASFRFWPLESREAFLCVVFLYSGII